MQSSDFINQHDWQQLSMENNAVAAQKVRDEKDPSQAAVAGEVAGEIYGLKKLAGPINNCPDNTTRFLILAKDRVYQAGAEKISLCFELPHRAGTLYSMLGNFIFNDVNMRMHESRPDRRRCGSTASSWTSRETWRMPVCRMHCTESCAKRKM